MNEKCVLQDPTDFWSLERRLSDTLSQIMAAHITV